MQYNMINLQHWYSNIYRFFFHRQSIYIKCKFSRFNYTHNRICWINMGLVAKDVGYYLIFNLCTLIS